MVWLNAGPRVEPSGGVFASNAREFRLTELRRGLLRLPRRGTNLRGITLQIRKFKVRRKFDNSNKFEIQIQPASFFCNPAVDT